MKSKSLALTMSLVVSASAHTEATESWGDAFAQLEPAWRGQYYVRMTQGLEDGELRLLEHSLESELDLSLPKGLRLHAEGRLRYEDRDQLEPGPSNDSRYRSDWNRRVAFSDRAEAELLALYVDGYVGDTYVKVGKQSIGWGAAIGLEVLDVVNPVTMREFVLPDRDERRLSLWALNLQQPLGDWMASLIWLPDTTYEQLPAQDGTFAFQPPVFLRQPDHLWLPADKPDDAISDADYGGQLTTFLSGWDVSLNYLYHYHDRPILELKSTGSQAPEGSQEKVQPVYYRTHTIGGSLSNAFGDFTLRAEAGYDTQQFFQNSHPAVVSGWSRSAEISTVIGVDYSGVRDWLISSQLFTSYLPDYEEGILRERRQDRATLLFRGDLLGHTQTAEMLVIHSLDDHDGILQFSWDYRVRSRITLNATLDIPYGERTGDFGQFRDNDQFSLGIEVSF